MGFMDLLKGGSAKNRCAQCKAEDKELAFSKRFDGTTHLFCSKECSRQFRIDRKKEKKKPQSSGGSSLPW